mgnify:CR=1|jgi:hypothetical protein
MKVKSITPYLSSLDQARYKLAADRYVETLWLTQSVKPLIDKIKTSMLRSSKKRQIVVITTFCSESRANTTQDSPIWYLTSRDLDRGIRFRDKQIIIRSPYLSTQRVIQLESRINRLSLRSPLTH